MRGVLGEMLERHGSLRKKIEKRLKPIMKERQPMLHARIASAFAHRFIKQVIGRSGTELGNVPRAKAADRLCDELEFRHRHKIEPPELFLTALGLRIKTPDRFQRIAEKVEADWHIHAGRIKVENSAAHGVFARLPHGRGPGKSIQFEPIDYPLHADDIAGCY